MVWVHSTRSRVDGGFLALLGRGISKVLALPIVRKHTVVQDFLHPQFVPDTGECSSW